MATIRETIFGSEDLDYEDAVVEEWGGVTLRMRMLSLEESAKYFKAFPREAGEGLSGDQVLMSLAWLVWVCSTDPATGERVFGPDDYDSICRRSPEVLERLGMIVLRLSGLTEQAAEDTISDFFEMIESASNSDLQAISAERLKSCAERCLAVSLNGGESSEPLNRS